MNHKEKDDLIAALRKRVEEIDSVMKSATGQGDLTETGFGIIKDENQDFYLVELLYDPNEGAAKVKQKINLGSDYAITLFKSKKYLVEQLLLKYNK